MEQLDQKLSDFITLLNERDENTKSCLVEIKNQVKYTNGKVRVLEKWKWGLSGALAVLAFSVANISNIGEIIIKLIK
jgi:hypothetical protein